MPSHPSVRKEVVETMSTFLLYKFKEEHLKQFGVPWIRMFVQRLSHDPNSDVCISIFSTLNSIFREVFCPTGRRDVDIDHESKVSASERFAPLADFVCRYLQPTSLSFLARRVGTFPTRVKAECMFTLVCVLSRQHELVESSGRVEYILDSQFAETDKEQARSKSYQSGPISSSTVTQDAPLHSEEVASSKTKKLLASLTDSPFSALSSIVSEQLVPLLNTGDAITVFEVGRSILFLSKFPSTRRLEWVFPAVKAYVALLRGKNNVQLFAERLVYELMQVLSYISFPHLTVFLFPLLHAIQMVPESSMVGLLYQLFTIFSSKNASNNLELVESSAGPEGKDVLYHPLSDYLSSNSFFKKLWSIE